MNARHLAQPNIVSQNGTGLLITGHHVNLSQLHISKHFHKKQPLFMRSGGRAAARPRFRLKPETTGCPPAAVPVAPRSAQKRSPKPQRGHRERFPCEHGQAAREAAQIAYSVTGTVLKRQCTVLQRFKEPVIILPKVG